MRNPTPPPRPAPRDEEKDAIIYLWLWPLLMQSRRKDLSTRWNDNFASNVVFQMQKSESKIKKMEV